MLIGVGNAYSDEILHSARLSPYATAGRLSEEALDRLHDALQRVLREAVARSVGQDAARLKGEKRVGLTVHARAGFPCPVCGDTAREVSFADRAFQYCPTCQTGASRWLIADCPGWSADSPSGEARSKFTPVAVVRSAYRGFPNSCGLDRPLNLLCSTPFQTEFS